MNTGHYPINHESAALSTIWVRRQLPMALGHRSLAAAEAEAIAEELLNQRLAACVNILPGLTSYYRWKGQICRDAEVAMVIKTAASAVDRCQQRLCEMHSAELPCILTFEPREGHPPFLDWVRNR